MKIHPGPVVLAFLPLLLVAALPQQDKRETPKLTAQEVMASYQRAIGGDRLDRVTTMVKKGETTQGQRHYTWTTFRKAPDLYARHFTESSGQKFSYGFDGKVLWAVLVRPPKTGQKVSLQGLLDGAPIATEFLLEPYEKAKLSGMKKVAERRAYAVETTEGPIQRTYYFDSETFLLLRKEVSVRHGRNVGVSAGREYLSRDIMEYSDWREVNGIKLPFEIHYTEDLMGGAGIHNDLFERSEGQSRILEWRMDVSLEQAVFDPPPGSVTQEIQQK